MKSIADRAAGAVLGALIGDALGLGPHWYYDLAELRKEYGDWIDDYVDPKPGRYHAGMKAGQLDQTGLLMVMLLRSIIEHREYVEEDFTRRLDEELFPLLDGTPMNGPGGYTSQSIREAFRRRVQEKKSLKETGGHTDKKKAAERAIPLASRYVNEPAAVARLDAGHCVLTQADESVV